MILISLFIISISQNLLFNYKANFARPKWQGISIVDKIEEAISAQEAGLTGSRHILERIGAVILKSDQINLSKNAASKIAELVMMTRQNLKSNGAMGLRPTGSIFG